MAIYESVFMGGYFSMDDIKKLHELIINGYNITSVTSVSDLKYINLENPANNDKYTLYTDDMDVLRDASNIYKTQ